jgi:hypothetical protein
MTYADAIKLVLSHVREHRGSWFLADNGEIRRHVGESVACSLSSLKSKPVSSCWSVATRLGIPSKAQTDIAMANDGETYCNEFKPLSQKLNALRRRLLLAARLTR